MRQKLHQAVIATATPLFNPGETPLATGRARVGTVSVGQNVALGVASMVLSGGTVGMYTVNKGYFVLLTSQRLLLLEPHWLTMRPTTKLAGNIPRDALHVVDVKRAVMTSVTLAVRGQSQGLQLKYPTLDKEGAESLLKALNVA